MLVADDENLLLHEWRKPSIADDPGLARQVQDAVHQLAQQLGITTSIAGISLLDHPAASGLYEQYLDRRDLHGMELVESRLLLGVEGHTPEDQARRLARAHLVSDESSRRTNIAYAKENWSHEPDVPDDRLVWAVREAGGDVRSVSVRDLYQGTVQAYDGHGREVLVNDEHGLRLEWRQPLQDSPELARQINHAVHQLSHRYGTTDHVAERVPNRRPQPKTSPPSLGPDTPGPPNWTP